MSDQNRLVLAYSGGLDTSVAISYLKERTGKDVVAVSLDVGQGGESLETIKQRALACGAVEAYVVDARDEFANEYCMKALKANAMYEGVYPLVSAISRPLISKHLVRAAHQFGADTISHGCTGKGNDQVRFEVSIASIDPTLKAISPIRDLSLTRDVEIAFAKEHKLPIVQTEKSPFSIDQNVWGRAIETGFLEDPWNGPTKDCYYYTDDPAFPPVEDEVVLEFKQGVTVKIDGHDVTQYDQGERTKTRREKIGFVYQFHHLLPDFNAIENVVLPQLIRGAGQAEAEERARQQAGHEQSFGEDDYPYDDGDNWSGEGE